MHTGRHPGFWERRVLTGLPRSGTVLERGILCRGNGNFCLISVLHELLIQDFSNRRETTLLRPLAGRFSIRAGLRPRNDP